MNVIRWDGSPISEPGIYVGVDMESYHGGKLCDGPSISSSGLRTIFNDSPMDYWINSPLNPLRVERAESEAFILGRAAHWLLLGEADFGKYFTVEPETYPDPKTGEPKKWNNNASFCREWHEHVAAQFLTVLTRNQIEQIRGMAGLLPWQEGLEDSGLANTAVVRAGALSGLVEHTIVARDKETGIFLLSRPDAIPLESTQFADFKTCMSVDLHSIAKSLGEYRYDMQAALAAECLRQAADVHLDSFAFIFGAKKPPHAVQVVELKPADLTEAAADNRIALQTFARCLETGKWPGPGGSQRDAVYVDVPVWAREQANTRRAFLETEIAA